MFEKTHLPGDSSCALFIPDRLEVTNNPSKGSRFRHPKKVTAWITRQMGFFCLPCWDCTTVVPPQNQPTLGVFTPHKPPPHLEEVFPPSVFGIEKKPSLKLTDKTPEFSGHLISGNEIRRIPTIHVERCKLLVSGRVFKKKTNIHAMWFKLWPLYPRSLEVTWPSQKGHKDLPGTVFFFSIQDFWTRATPNEWRLDQYKKNENQIHPVKIYMCLPSNLCFQLGDW